jgi:hypothetical protein
VWIFDFEQTLMCSYVYVKPGVALDTMRNFNNGQFWKVQKILTVYRHSTCRIQFGWKETRRVTRLGEFSPVGWLILGDFFPKLQMYHNFFATFPRSDNYALILTREWLGDILGYFFHKLIRGRCYNHNILLFLTIFGEKIGVFLQNHCYDQHFE